MNYETFLESKLQLARGDGVDFADLPDSLFPFQRALVSWALERGRGAMFADCGLGKTPMQLVWADIITRSTNKPTLILTPLAVSQQTIREAQKFGIEAERSSGATSPRATILVTNYEKLHHFNSSDFGAVVCDESSAIKSFNGKRRAEVTEFMRRIPYRLLCTATAAPNDYIELGTSSEAIGEMGYMDMLNRFFKNDSNAAQSIRRWAQFNKPKWRFKGHAEIPFWKWVCSWARACRRPSDLGFDDEGFILPAPIENEHVVESRTLPEGQLFALAAQNMQEERAERRRTIEERCEYVASIVANTGQPAVIWCHLNDESKRVAELIPDAVEVSGSDSDEKKEESFIGFADGSIRVIVTKPKIGAWGLNWPHCNHVVTFASHSYEQYYQAVRRCWRFGQTRQVVVDIVRTEGEQRIKENLQRKSLAASKMFDELVAHMNDAQRIHGQQYTNSMEAPSWL